MYWAAKHGNVPAVRACLESGMDVNKVLNEEKRTALHVAAHVGHAALVKALIEAGADVNKLASPQFFLNDASGKRRKRTNYSATLRLCSTPLTKATRTSSWSS